VVVHCLFVSASWEEVWHPCSPPLLHFLVFFFIPCVFLPFLPPAVPPICSLLSNRRPCSLPLQICYTTQPPPLPIFVWILDGVFQNSIYFPQSKSTSKSNTPVHRLLQLPSFPLLLASLRSATHTSESGHHAPPDLL
jgi:hypothetical protein